MNLEENEKVGIDKSVDDEIFNCLNLENPKSFFLFAGAGSGKTRSLVNVLKRIDAEKGKTLLINNQRVAIITYTNAACDEIKHRLNYNFLFVVSTIHSFLWELIKNYQFDLKLCVKEDLLKDINVLEEQQKKGRIGTKAFDDRIKKLERKKIKLANIEKVNVFIYNPLGDNRSSNSLNHAEVIRYGSYFIKNKSLMQKIMIKKYPILLIDESQDTNKHLIEAFFETQKENSKNFSLGLFGDTMQRIYSDGDLNLGRNIPDDWVKPMKRMNYRCPIRVITLINKIRSVADNQYQIPRKNKSIGIVRLFITSSEVIDKQIVESKVAQRMQEITGEHLWSGDNSDVKCLILEHHMAAKRMGFFDLFSPLYKDSKLNTGFLNGSLSGLNIFTKIILPIVEAKRNGDEFLVSQIVRYSSPYLKKENLKKSVNQLDVLRKVEKGIQNLYSFLDGNSDPKLSVILRCIADEKIFDIPESLISISNRSKLEQIRIDRILDGCEVPEETELLDAWDYALNCPFSQIEAYNKYIKGNSKFGTHQGVKGLEFPRVMIILDDEEAKGFLFSYEKLFGVKDPSKTDLKNKDEGKETGIERTRRLFYVTCSRVEESLAIVAYTNDPKKLVDHVIKEDWFDLNEIEIL